MRFSDWLSLLKTTPRHSRRDLREFARRHRVAALLETLENRVMLSGVTAGDYDQVAREWFGSQVAEVQESVGPVAPSSQYILRLTEWMSSRTEDVGAADSLLACEANGFRLVGGLGLPGQLLLDVDDHRLDEVINTFADHPFVASLERDFSVSGTVQPNDTRFDELSGLHNTAQGDGVADADIDAVEAWDTQTGSHGIVVATLDTGLDYTHPDLYQNVWINPGEIPAAIVSALVDTDSDGLTTFVDLNHPDNSDHVTDHNGNSYIDAGDLLSDGDWEDGEDTDGNGKIDDLVGWDFVNNDNDPYDDHRHGTHVAGIIGARGNNATGVTGVNWATSILPLKFLDEHNKGATSAAIHAVNYATSLQADSAGNIRVLNNSWGGLGGYNANLRSAISTAATNEMLFVAAAGNGNVLGRGIDLDTDDQAFYPAGYDLDNILSVAATDSYDNLALFSNHGVETIDLAAPGLDVLSTEPGGGYIRRNGTSMAAPFASGAAALIWSELPDATVAEVTAALVGGVDAKLSLDGKVVTGGRLNVDSSLDLDTYAPRAELTVADEVTTDGGTTYDFTVKYRDNVAVDVVTLDNNDIVVVPVENPDEPIAATLVSTSTPFNETPVTVEYRIVPPGGSWQVSDNGVFQVVLQPGQVADANTPANSSFGGVLGTFEVSIAYEGQIDVDVLTDAADANPGDGVSADDAGNSTLRSAIQEANAASGLNTLVLTEGATYSLSVSGGDEDASASGDLDVTDDLVIHGNGATIEVTGNIDRVLDVFAGATVTLQDLTLTGGQVTGVGGGVRNAGVIDATGILVTGNTATGDGGGVHNSGTLTMTNTTISGNTVTASGSQGAGIANTASGAVSLESVTITENEVTGAPDARGRQVIATGLTKPETLRTGDIDGDGDLDLVVGVETGVVWYANDGTGTFGDSVAICLCHDEGATGTRALNLVDVDADDDLDVFFAPAVPGTSPVQGWYENDGSGTFVERSLDSLDLSTNDAESFDYDGDGDQDLLFTFDNETEGVAGSVTVFEQQVGPGTFPSKTISDSVDGAYRLVAADLDGDGDTDAISAGLVDDTIAWHENDGNQNFTKRVIASDVTDARSVFSADVDGDGDVDVIAASQFKDSVTWYENDGSQNFSAHLVTTSADGVFGVFAADVDGDGDVDLLSASVDDDTVAWYENDGSENFSAHTIATDVDFATSVYAADIDGDGDVDVLSSSFTDGITWHVNDGSETFSAATIDSSVQGAQTVIAADVDGDDDMDILSASQNDDTIAWYRNDGDGDFSKQVITATADEAKTVVAADIDGDGDVDVLSASAANDTVALFRNDGSENFTQTTISTTADGAQGVFAADVDSDGDLDVLSASENDGTIAWYENDAGLVFAAVDLDVTGAGQWALEPADLDGDGDTDLVVSTTETTVSSGRLTFEQMVVEASDVSFAAQSVIHSVDGAEAGGAADLDGDGDQDLLTTYRSGVKLMLGNGDGTFASPVTVDGSLGIPRAMTIADLDGDSDFDFVTGEVHGGRLLAWYENNGSASFTRRTIGNLPGHINGITHVDYDGDGDLDLVVAVDISGDNTGGQFSKFTNNGDGTFTSAGNLSDTGSEPWGVSAADFDGDGDQDLVVSRTGSSPVVAWYANDGSGNFVHVADLSGTYGSMFLTTADLNGDGAIDVLVAAGSHDKVVWYANNGSGSFTEQAALSTTVNTARWVLAADLDKDGDLDVAAASDNSKIAWFRNENGNGSFSGEIILANDMTSSDGLAAADVNGDGVMDIITSDHLLDRIYWHRGIGTGGWDNLVSPVVSPDGSSVFVGDNTNHALWALERNPSSGELSAISSWTDGDGSVDGLAGVSSLAISPDGQHVYTAASTDNAIGVFQKTSGFLSEETVSSTADGAVSVFAIDVDGDGDTDILSASQYDDTIAWHENDGNQVFTERVITSDANMANSVYAVDVDGDNDIDVLSASDTDNTIAWYENNGSQVFAEHVISSTANRAREVFATDVDGDSDIDVLSASMNDDKIAWYENDGSENFVERVISTDADGAQDVFAADVDSDGDVDVLSASYEDDKIAWYENDGEESFTAHVITTVADGAETVVAIDVDGDGDTDVISASSQDNTIAWYENDGSQNFTERVISTSADDARDVFPIDVDGDGDIDVATASLADDTIAWYENDGSQGFTQRVISTNADFVRGVFAADVDSDGDIDVLSASRDDDKVAWYENTPSLDFIEVARDGTGGVDGLVGVRDVVVSNDGQHVYAASGTDNAVSVFSRNTTTGALSFVEAHIDAADGVEGLAGASAVAISADDSLVHVTGAADQEVATFSRNASNGKLRFNASIDDGSDDWLDNVSDVLVAPSGGDVYTTSPDGGAVGVLHTETEFLLPAVIDSAADTARNVYATDLDGDGDTDVLTAAYVDDAIIWYQNLGASNTFSAHTITTAVDGAQDVFAIDMDDDGDVDVLAAAGLDDEIAWYENDGDENFSAHTIATGVGWAASVRAVDVDGDGDVDVLSAAESDNEIAWYENDGAENFTTHSISTTASEAWSVHADDLDGDGDMDVLSASFGDDRIAWYENDGSENFTTHTISSTAGSARSVYTADVDSDGDIDVLSASRADDKIAWYENDGSQGFTAHSISTTADSASGVHAADLDGDGDIDVVSSSEADGKVAWYENNGSQEFVTHTLTTSQAGASGVHVADVDGDGRLDVLSASNVDDTIAWYESVQVLELTETEIDGVNDVDGVAGARDAVISSDGVSVYVTGTDEDKLAVFARDAVTGELSFSQVLEDGVEGVDGLAAANDLAISPDGHHVYVTAWDDNSISVFNRETVDNPAQADIHWLRNDGDGVFSRQSTITTSVVTHTLASGDLDGDGDLDLLAASDADDRVWWYRNNGSGGFSGQPAISDSEGAERVIPADMDNDGDLDVLATSRLDDTVGWYPNDGSGGFGVRVVLDDNLDGADGLDAVDLDDDGVLDVVAAGFEGGELTWYPGTDPVVAGISNAAGGTVTLHNTLIASDSSATNLWDVRGSFSSSGFNLIGNAGNSGGLTHGSNGDQVGRGNSRVEPLLGPLADNAGPTWTHALLENSPAIDAGTNTGAPVFDQRGIARPQDANEDGVASGDIGAVERYFVELSGTKFHDANANRVKDEGESGLAGWTIFLDENGNRELDPGERTETTREDDPATATDEAGTFSFSRVEPGDLIGVEEIQQEGWEQIFPVVTSFLESQSFEVFSGGQALLPFMVVAGDFDADGHVDLAVSNAEDGKVAVLFTDGAGAITGTELNHGLLSAVGLGGGDMDGDGDLDLVTVLRQQDEVAVLINDGSGSFGQEENKSLGGDGGHLAMQLKLGDLDGDGDLDVATANSDTNTVSVLFNGTTTVEDGFKWMQGNTVVYDVGDTPRGLEIADLDDDGDADIVVADSEDEVLRILVNDGAGVFTNHDTLLAAGRHPTDIVAVDLDADGDLDLATPNSNSDDLSVFINQGDLVFSAEVRYQTGGKPQYSILAVDIDGDEFPDLVVNDQNDDTISIFRNKGDGTFREREAFAVGDKPWSVVAADFDGDGDSDLVSADNADASLSLLVNTTTVGGYSGVPTPGTVVDDLDFGNKPLPAEISGRVFRDLNGNGTSDAGEAGLSGWTVFVDANDDGVLDGDEMSRVTDANGNYLFADLEPLLTYTIVQVDQQHYEQTSPPLAQGQKWTITPLPGDVHDGQDFGNQDQVSGASGGTGIIKGIHFDDLDGDGQQGAEEVGLPGMTVYLDINNNGSRDTGDDAEPSAVTDGDGKYQFNSLPESVYTVRTEPVTLRQQTAPLGNEFSTTEHTAGDGPQWISHGDMDDDGDTDLAVANQVNNTVSLLINDGSGEFSESAAPYVGAGPESVALADFNGDGRLDLAVGHQYTSFVSVLLDNGNGGYEDKVDYTTAGGAGAVTAGDFNSDGHPDLAVANEFADFSGTDTLTVLLNVGDGSGTFDSGGAVTLAAGNAPVSIVSGDFNADDKDDLAVANMEDDTVMVLLNAGGASFPTQASFTFNVGTGPFHLATGDLDGDGDVDLATANVLSDSISVLTNSGNGTSFSVSNPLPAGSGPASLVAEDLDNDGDLDLAATNRNTENLAILRNLGGGTFQSPENFGVADFSTPLAWSVVAVDLDGDGDNDLAVANGDADRVSMMDNTLVPGSFRVTVDDGATVSDVDFGIHTPVTTGFSDGVLSIESEGDDPWDITVDVLDGNVRVLVGDTVDDTIGTIDPSDVTLITVTASAGGERIDLSGVTAADFDHPSGMTTNVDAGDGDDTIVGSELPDTILGGGGSDVITGDGGADSVVGGDGDDTVDGQAGGDTVLGGPGDDSLSGGDGDDYMESEGGADTFLGGDGNDTIHGGAENDELYGQAGDDELFGEGDDDLLSGGAGNDTLNSGAGNDTVNGNAGSDQIVGDDKNVVLTVELDDAAAVGSTFEIVTDGTEVLVRQQGGAELSRGSISQLSQLVVWGTSNDDTVLVDFSAGSPLPTNGVHFDASVGGGSDRLETLGSGVSSVVHTFDSSTTGSLAVDGLPVDHTGVATIHDGVTTTTRSFIVGDGDDVIALADDGASANGISRASLSAFSGTIDFSGPTDKLVVSTGNGSDTVTISGLDSAMGTSSLLLNGQNDPDTLDASGSHVPVKLNGSGGDDILTGGTAADTLNGGSGADSLVGGEGNDRLQGQGSSYDTLRGEAGDDTLDGGDGYDRISESADVDFTATDNSLTGLGNDTLINIQLVQLFGGSTANTIDASAFSGRAFLNGSGGNDTLTGGGWYDRIFGGSGRDLIIGGTSVIDPGPGTYTYDVLRGQGGNNDTLVGGDGNDKLNGGVGRDSLLGAGGDDVVTGESGNDTIDGGDGTDRLYERGNVDLTLSDTALTGGLGSNVLTSIETAYLKGGNGNNHFDASSFSGHVTMIGVGGDDTLKGGAGNDMINGRSGDDLITGGDGNDTLLGMRDADTLNGGAGDDSIDGGTQDDAISGWTGNDELYGRSGNDILVGGDGDDTLYGAADNDILQGDDGKSDTTHEQDNDRLDGGDGSDTVRGGGGADIKLDDAPEIDESFTYWAEWVDAV